MSEATLALDWWLSVVVTSARVGRLVDWSVWERSERSDRQRGLCLTDLSKNCHLAFCQTAVLLPAHQKSHQHFSVEKPCCPDSYIGQLVTHSFNHWLVTRSLANLGLPCLNFKRGNDENRLKKSRFKFLSRVWIGICWDEVNERSES